MQSVVNGADGYAGTAKYCAINGIDVAAKTGTTNSSKDRWLCGFTNYYTAATWYGFDNNEKINTRYNTSSRKNKFPWNEPSRTVILRNNVRNSQGTRKFRI